MQQRGRKTQPEAPPLPDFLLTRCELSTRGGAGVVPLPLAPEELLAVVEHSLEVVLVMDARGMLRYANRAGAALLRYTPQEDPKGGIVELVHSEDQYAFSIVLEAAGASEGAVENILEVRISDGKGGWRTLSGTLRRMGGSLVLHAQDITERKQQANHLRRVQGLATLGQLAGGVAHEFSNLLSVMLCYAELAFDSLTGDDEVREEVKEIRLAAERAAQLVGRLLGLARWQPRRPREVNLNELVESMARTLTPVLHGQIHVSTALAANLDAVCADPGEIEQVLLNLALNSRDAMPFGGEITIGTGNVRCEDGEVPDLRAGDYVRLVFRDTGQGMDARTANRVFEPFFTTKGRGTGLGLSTVRSIVERYGGRIVLHSERHKGTTFQIYFPKSGRNPGAGEAAA